jgi:hypothetical protein
VYVYLYECINLCVYIYDIYKYVYIYVLVGLGSILYPSRVTGTGAGLKTLYPWVCRDENGTEKSRTVPVPNTVFTYSFSNCSGTD